MTSPYVLYAHRDDEITTLLDAIDAQKGSEVLVVVPEGAMLFRDSLNLKLLKRECEKLGKSLMISTQDVGGIAMAKKAGITVETPSEGEKFFEDWGRLAPPQSPLSTSGSGKRSLAARTPNEDASGGGNVSSEVGNTRRARKTSRGMDIMRRRRQPHAIAAVVDSAVPRQRIEPSAHTIETAEETDRLTAATPTSPDVYAADAVLPTVETEAPRAVSVVTTVKLSRRIPWTWIGAVAALACGFAAAAFFIKPSATVTVWPKEETVEFEMDMSGRTDISAADAQKALIPLERVRVEKEVVKEFPASGKRQVVSRSKGLVTVYNEFSSAPQPLVATTRFRLGDGKIFRTPKAVVIPGAKIDGGSITAGTVEIEVIADEPGESYNVPPSRFSIPGFAGTPRQDAFYAISAEPMAGGFDGVTPVVEEADIANARSVLVEQETPLIEAELQKKLPPGLIAISGGMHSAAGSASASPAAGEPGASFTLTLQMLAEALLFAEDDVLRVVEPNIAEHLATQYTAVPETRHIDYTLKQIDTAIGRLVFTTLVTLKTQAVVDTRELVLELVGMPIGNTQKFFDGQSKVERADLSLWPFWARNLPDDAERISVIIGERER